MPTNYKVPQLGEYTFQQPVKDKDLTAPPGNPVKGDRYLIISISGDETIDQEQLLYDYSLNYLFGTRRIAQTFKSGSSGELFKIVLWLAKEGSPNNLIVELRDIADSKPGSTIYATQEINVESISAGENTIIFSFPYSISSNTNYSIVCYQKENYGDIDNYYWVYGSSSNPYSNGSHVYSTDGGSTWTIQFNLDLYFKTYIEGNLWEGKENYIATYNGSGWDFTAPLEGMICWIEDEDLFYLYDGNNWVVFDHTKIHTQNTDKKIIDADADTQIQVEESPDEDKIRMDVKGVEAFVLNDDGILDLAKQSRCRAFKSVATQTIGTGTWAKVTLDGETYDNQNEFDSITNNRFTAIKAGTYLVIINGQYTSGVDATEFYLAIYKNGVAVSYFPRRFSDVYAKGASGSDVIVLAVNDYIEFYTLQSTGADRSLNKGTEQTFMSIHKLS